MTHSFERELAAAVRAVRYASEICRAVQSQIDPTTAEKQDKSPVTVADFASQAVVCRILGELFPHDPIIAEEDAAFLRDPQNKGFLERVQQAVSQCLPQAAAEEVCDWIDRGGASEYSPRFWTLDPIDGTKGFLRKEQYAVSLALIVEGRIELGVLGCPNLARTAASGPRGYLFCAVRGRGAEARPLASADNPGAPVRASSTSDPREARLCESVESGHSSHSDSEQIAGRLGLVQEPARLDSQAKYAVVADGTADIYLRLPTKKDYRERIWDHAGGVILVEEAGGRVSDVDGKPLEFTHGSTLAANRGVVVTNAPLHERVLSVVQQVLGGEELTA